MIGVLEGFAIIGVVIATGYLVGRVGLLGPHARHVLSRIVFSVLSPCLLFTVLADADVRVLFSSLLGVSAIAAVVCFALAGVVVFGVWRRRLGPGLIATMASGYVNANNIGLPVAVYVLGDAAYTAPVILLQLVVITPIVLVLLDAAGGGRVSVRSVALSTVRNPLIAASALGVLVSVTGWEPPEPVLEPFRLVGAAAVPLVLISFGMSLSGARPLAPGSGRRDVLLASMLKAVVMPLAAWALGAFAFGLRGEQLFAVTVLAGLPTAQNVFNYAQRFDQGEVIARDTVLITTLAAVPVLVVVGALLGGPS